jgi:glycosyltransferase involved in cell wall biosynthesis
MSATLRSRRARIGLDLSVLAGAAPGSSARRWARPAFEALRARASFELVPLGLDAPAGRGARALRLRRAVAGAELDLLHGMTSGLRGWPALGPGGPLRVQTVHELPWRHGVREGADLAHRFWVRAGRAAHAHAVCPTQHVAHDLIAAGHAPTEVTVLPWGVDHAFHAHPGSVGGSARLVLPLAGREKKRAPLAVAALAHLPREVTLELTGPDGPGLARARLAAETSGVAHRVRYLGTVPDEALPGLFAGAGAVLALAPSEGFCLPVAESLAVGTPTVVPDGGAQAEVAAGGGVVCREPDDARCLADAIERALGFDDAARARAREVGAHYTWNRWADTATVLWETLLEQRR